MKNKENVLSCEGLATNPLKFAKFHHAVLKKEKHPRLLIKNQNTFKM